MTLPTPTAPATPAPTHAVPRLNRWKLTEPVRLYLWPVAVLLIVGGVAGGIVTQDYGDWALSVLGGLLTAGGAAAARSSVYSTAGVVREMRRAAGPR
jgi:hypothetical protein